MATQIFTTGYREYTQCIGSYELGYGVRNIDGSYPSYRKIPVKVKFTETTKVCRGLTSAALPTSSTVTAANGFVASDWAAAVTMATNTVVYGSTGNLKTVQFDYESGSCQCEVHRAAECGFYEAVSVVRSGTVV